MQQKLAYDYDYKVNKVGLNSFSMFKGIKSVPTAEKWALAGTIFTLAVGCLSGSQVLTMGAFVLSLAKYGYEKYHQDQAVDAYYKEISGVYLPTESSRIYKNSPNVAAMGGFDAIENACALRVFTKS